MRAVAMAHGRSVVHRDLKPENIVLEKQRGGGEIVKVVDFGLAKLTGQPASSSITSPGLVCGTPDYMSPEQGRGEDVDGRGDLYSVGIVLWELLADKLQPQRGVRALVGRMRGQRHREHGEYEKQQRAHPGPRTGELREIRAD